MVICCLFFHLQVPAPQSMQCAIVGEIRGTCTCCAQLQVQSPQSMQSPRVAQGHGHLLLCIQLLVPQPPIQSAMSCEAHGHLLPVPRASGASQNGCVKWMRWEAGAMPWRCWRCCRGCALKAGRANKPLACTLGPSSKPGGPGPLPQWQQEWALAASQLGADCCKQPPLGIEPRTFSLQD